MTMRPHCFVLIAVTLALPAALAQSPAFTPKPAPEPGARGTVEFWEKQLQGKFKPQVKADLGTPTGGIEQTGDIYIYKSEFFHPDLDEWRDLRITFSSKDGAVESFTGSGGDTKVYPIGSPTADEVATPNPTPTPAPNTDELLSKIRSSVVTIEYTQQNPDVDEGAGATGFIVNYKGKKYVLTNIHVLEGEANAEVQSAWFYGPLKSGRLSARDPSKAREKMDFNGFLGVASQLALPRAKTADGKDLKLGETLLLCADRDVALIPVESDVSALDISTEPPANDNSVVVAGNSFAAHTILGLEATISLVGPERFTVTPKGGAPALAGGMSGSPVVDRQTGKVLGVVSYLVVRKPSWLGDEVVRGSGRATVIRHYDVRIDNTAYRLDNLDNLQPITWSIFLKDYAVYLAARERVFNVDTATDAVTLAISGAPPLTFGPDFSNRVQLLYASFCRDFRRLYETSDAKYMMDKWDSYRKNLEIMLSEGSESSITTPYIRLQFNNIAAASSRAVTEKLQAQQGKVSTLTQQFIQKKKDR